MKSALPLLILGLTVPGLARAEPVSDCTKLAGMEFKPAAIGMPTNGARVDNAVVVPASGEADNAIPAHCLISGTIAPVDPKSWSIHFQVAAPIGWNGKALMLGGGGFDGVIPKVAGTFLNAVPGTATPLARGYAVFGGDSGHQIKQAASGFSIGQEDGVFFGNDEAYRNYIGDALKKTRDVAMRIILQYYGRAPDKAYFLGGSKGGGEAITVAARWPADWNGIVALYPARNYVVASLGALSTSQALAARGAYLNLAQRGLLYRAALAACDALDGAKDSLISNVRGCSATFDPATALLDGKPLRCPSGNDGGDACLSDAQIWAVKRAESPTRFGFRIASGETDFPGFNFKTSGLGNSGSSPLETAVAMLTIGLTPPASPTAPGNSMAANFTDNFMRYAVARDSGFNQLAFDFAKPGRMGQRLTALSRIDLGDADLSGFARRGGKLLIMHGTDDLLVSPRATERYYNGLRTKMGARRLEAFLRYYEVPGFGHAMSTVFGAAWDQLAALEGWVERGVDPAGNQIVVDITGHPGRTRPLCLYPSWPKYKGSGDLNEAASFVCAAK